MNRIISIISAVALMVTAISCNDNLANSTIGNSCTILIYGSGGGGFNIDYDVMTYLVDAVNESPNSKVKVAMEYNFMPSAGDSELPYISGTSFIVLNGQAVPKIEIPDISGELKQCKSPADTNALINAKCNEIFETLHQRGLIYIEKLDGTNKVPLYKPESMASFIRKAHSVCRSERYILSISGHGSGWTPDADNPLTKASSWDDNFNAKYCISATNLVDGIRQSGLKDNIKCIYLDACMMNVLDNLCEYSESGVPLAVGSIEITNGYNYGTLMQALKNVKNTDEGFETALMSALNSIYCADQDKTCGMMLVDLQKVTSILPDIKRLVELLHTEYPENKPFYNGLISSLQGPGPEYTIRDFSEFLYLLANDKTGTVSDDLIFESKAILETLRSQVDSYYGANSKVKDLAFTGVHFIGRTQYSGLCSKGLKTSYEMNPFYAATGWNTLFEIFDDEVEKYSKKSK